MPGSEHDQEEAGSQEEVMVLLRSLVSRQDRLEERMASDRGRGEAQSNPGRERQDGVVTGGNLPAPGGVHVDEIRYDESVESSGVNVGPREFSSIKQAVPKFSGKPEEFPVWSKRFEAFVSMSGCLGSMLTDIEVAVGDTTKDTQYFISQGLSRPHIKNARVAWICLTESMTDTDLLDRVFARQSPSGAWRMLRDWFLPKSVATQVKWSDAFDAVQMEKGEEPMKFFSRVDKIVGTLASLGVPKSEGEVNRKLVRVLTADYEIEQRTLLYRDEITRAEIESIVRQRHLRLPVPKGKNVGQALFSNGTARGGRGGGRGGNRGGGRGSNRNNVRSRNKGSANADASQGSEGSSSPPTPKQTIPQSEYDKVKGKCIRCLEPGHMWYQCKARVTPASERTSGEGAQGQNNSGETVCCLANAMFSRSDDSCTEERSESITESLAEKWIADSGASFHMTHSADLLSDVRLCDDKVRIGDNHLIDVVGYGTLTVVFPGDLTVKLLDVAYMPDLAFNLFSLMAAHKQGVGFMTEDEGLCISLFDGRLRFEGDGSSYSNFACRIEPDNGYVPFPLLTPDPAENRGETGCDFPLAFPVLAPGSAASAETAVDINIFHCVHGHSNELLLRETAKALGVELLGTLRPCTGCSMAKGYRKPIPSSTKSRAPEKLGRVFVDLSGPKRTPSLLGKRYVMLVKDDFSRYAWVYFLKHKSDAADAFRKFLADVRADGVPSKVEIVRSDNGGEFFGGEFGEVCKQFCIKQEFTNADSPKQNGVVERALGIIQNAALAACIQAPIIFPLVQLPPTESLWAEAVHWSCDALNHTATTANPGNKSPHEMWHGAAAPASPHPFLRPAYCRWNRPSKSSPRAESCFYLGPGIDHPSDSLRMLTRGNRVVETRDVTWEATLDVGAVLSQLPEVPEQGGTQGLEDAPELGGTEDFVSAPTTPLPVLGRGIPHQLRAVSPMTQAVSPIPQAGDEFRAEDVEPNDTSAVSSELSDSDSSSQDGSDASASDDEAPTPTAVRTAARQLGAHMSGPGDGEEIREGRTRAQTRALNREAAAGLISAIGPCEGGRVFQALLAANEAECEKTKLPDCLVKEAEPEPTSYTAARTSKHSDVWMDAMRSEFDGLEAAGTFVEVSELPASSNIVESKWLLKWKSDAHGMIDRAKARLVAKGYSQVEGVDYFETFAPTASTTSNRLIAAMACKLDWDLRHLDVDQAFIQAELDTEIFLRLPRGCGEMSGKVVLLNKALYGLKQSGRSWYKLLSSTLVECGFEQCLVDPCVFRLMLNDAVVAMLVVHVDDIKIAATKEVTDSVVADLNKRFPTKHLGEVTWYMGSEYRRDREKGTLEISQTQFIRNVVDRFGITKTSPIPASPSLDLRYVSDEEPVVDANFREIVGSLMWIANQTRPDISNAVRAIARFSHNPKEVHVKAARKVLEYLSATAHLGLTFRKESKLGDVQLEYDLETYVDADYAHKAEDRRSVSGVAVCCGGTLVSWFSRTQKCVTLSTTEAEYVAMADGVKEALYVRGVLVFLMPSLGSPSIGVFEDNKGAIDLAKNPLSSSNSKHIDVRYHFLRELVGKGDLCVKYLRTEDQHADILTKAIARESFEKHRDFLLGI